MMLLQIDPGSLGESVRPIVRGRRTPSSHQILEALLDLAGGGRVVAASTGSARHTEVPSRRSL